MIGLIIIVVLLCCYAGWRAGDNYKSKIIKNNKH